MKSIARDLDIAIIGMSCRFPGANNLATFWTNLCQGIESISFFDKEQPITTNSESGIPHIKAGAILEDIDLFDASFFNYSPREAEIADPQQRVFLECAWEALEDAGCNPYNYKGLIGVYAGVGLNSYLINNILPSDGLKHPRNYLGSMMGLRFIIGNDKDYLPTYVSYKLNLRGPSVNVQTACSTSLVAVHLACQAILNGECDMALAGTSNIIVPQKSGYYFQEGMAFSPDGHCRTFDASAQGTVFGSGVGVIVIKSLQNAIEEGDAIYAVIKGTAINNDGALKVGYTAPSVEGQSAVIKEALAVSEVESETISYIEAHGTATPMGDPIEVAALTQAFDSEKRGFCAIGSVKTNVGHLGWTAGMAGLIKTALSLQNRKIPPSLHFKKPNPQINFEKSPFYVNTQLKDWVTNGTSRRAGVSAFGIGGTNAHIILEEFSEIIPEEGRFDLPCHVLTLSAKTQDGLIELAKKYRDSIASIDDINFQHVCYTTNIGRNHFNHRLAIVASSCKKAYEKLVNYVDVESGKIPTVIRGNNELSTPQNRRVAFLFAGQETQNHAMGLNLYEAHPVFRRKMDECNAIYKKITKTDLLEIIYSKKLNHSQPNLAEFYHPAIYSLEVSLADLWKSWGVEPDFVIGHELGEYAAAYTAGVFSLENGLNLAMLRGKLKQSVLLQDENIDIILQDLKATLKEIIFSSPRTKMISNINGQLIERETAFSDYWYDHIKAKDNLKCGIEFINSTAVNTFIEMGSKSNLPEVVNQYLDGANSLYVPSLCIDNQNDWERMLISLGELYVNGYTIDWNLFHKDYKRRIVHLPTYSFQRQRYWIGERESESD